MMGSVTIFRSSPRKNGNTNALADVVAGELTERGVSLRQFDLCEMTIRPCTACRQCQQDWSTISCPRWDGQWSMPAYADEAIRSEAEIQSEAAAQPEAASQTCEMIQPEAAAQTGEMIQPEAAAQPVVFADDMPRIFEAVAASELLILATPVYSWYCTPPMKAMLDRLVYAENMYYGGERGPSLWAGRKVALITTCGYPPEKGADLLEEGIRRYCRHSQLRYEGMLCARHLGYDIPFMNEERERQARQFAETLIANL